MSNMQTFYLYLSVKDDVLNIKTVRDDSNDDEDFLTELLLDSRNDAEDLVKLIQKCIDFCFAKHAIDQLVQEQEAKKDISKLN